MSIGHVTTGHPPSYLRLAMGNLSWQHVFQSVRCRHNVFDVWVGECNPEKTTHHQIGCVSAPLPSLSRRSNLLTLGRPPTSPLAPPPPPGPAQPRPLPGPTPHRPVSPICPSLPSHLAYPLPQCPPRPSLPHRTPPPPPALPSPPPPSPSPARHLDPDNSVFCGDPCRLPNLSTVLCARTAIELTHRLFCGFSLLRGKISWLCRKIQRDTDTMCSKAPPSNVMAVLSNLDVCVATAPLRSAQTPYPREPAV